MQLFEGQHSGEVSICMYYCDLTQYAYTEKDSSLNRINIGWLSKDHPFLTGAVVPSFIEKLKDYARFPYNVSRGFHCCELCFDAKGVAHTTDIEGARGNREIWVKSKDGKTYIAPSLICHYIEVHHYLPPSEFIEAALSPAEHPSIEYYKREEAFLDEMYEALGEKKFFDLAIYSSSVKLPQKYVDMLKARNIPVLSTP